MIIVITLTIILIILILHRHHHRRRHRHRNHPRPHPHHHHHHRWVRVRAIICHQRVPLEHWRCFRTELHPHWIMEWTGHMSDYFTTWKVRAESRLLDYVPLVPHTFHKPTILLKFKSHWIPNFIGHANLSVFFFHSKNLTLGSSRSSDGQRRNNHFPLSVPATLCSLNSPSSDTPGVSTWTNLFSFLFLYLIQLWSDKEAG